MLENTDGLVGSRYRLEGRIGQGGMGRVWRAYDTTLDRRVALKEIVVPGGIGEHDLAIAFERVRREARAAARLNHPGIVRVHDVLEHEGAPVIVMEFLEGPTLQAAVASRGPLTVSDVARIAADILDALQIAHAAGVVHRDLKPDNIVMAADGRTVITDFGIARLIGGSTPLTVPGSVLGTPAYMAPEMINGGEATAATDLWSLGATLYAALEGHPPFEGDSITEICVAIVSRPVPAAPNAGALADLLNRLLVKEPAQRATALEATALVMQQRRPPTQPTMDTQLAAATAPTPTLTRTAPLAADSLDPIRSDASRRKQRRRKAVGSAIVISAVLVAGIIALSPWDDRSGQKTGTAAASSPTPTKAATTPSPTAGSPTPATPAAVAPTTSPTDTITAWESGGGASKLTAVQNDVTLASEAAAAGHGAALLGWCDQLTSDEAAAEKYRPIPDTVVQIHWADALYDAYRAANYCADWENSSGQDQAMLNAATTTFDQAATELQTVTTRLHQLGG